MTLNGITWLAVFPISYRMHKCLTAFKHKNAEVAVYTTLKRSLDFRIISTSAFKLSFFFKINNKQIGRFRFTHASKLT